MLMSENSTVYAYKRWTVSLQHYFLTLHIFTWAKLHVVKISKIHHRKEKHLSKLRQSSGPDYSNKVVPSASGSVSCVNSGEGWWWICSSRAGITSSWFASSQYQNPWPGRRIHFRKHRITLRHVFPSFALISWVISWVRAYTGLSVILIPLFWPHQDWFSDLPFLLVVNPPEHL